MSEWYVKWLVKWLYICHEMKFMSEWMSWLNESFHRMSWVNESFHTWKSHVTYESVIHRCDMTPSHVQHDSCRTRTNHRWMSHVTHMNESCHTYQWVVSHIWMSRVTMINESCHIQKSHVIHINESRPMSHTHRWPPRAHNEWVMSHTWTSHVTHMNESCHTYV